MLFSLLSSIKKSRRLKRLSNVLGAEVSVENFTAAADNNAKALNELFDFCEADSDLSRVLANYSANRSQLEATYEALIANGAGQWTRGHYVAVSALVSAPTLEYVLSAPSRGDNLYHVVFKLVGYFERGKVGPVE